MYMSSIGPGPPFSWEGPQYPVKMGTRESPKYYENRDPGPHFPIKMGTHGPQFGRSPFSHDTGFQRTQWICSGCHALIENSAQCISDGSMVWMRLKLVYIQFVATSCLAYTCSLVHRLSSIPPPLWAWVWCYTSILSVVGKGIVGYDIHTSSDVGSLRLLV